MNYTGELWRTNGTPTTGLTETYTVYYQLSAAAVTNIISGTNSNTPAAGTGFTALGAAANWTSPTILPPASMLDGNAAANRTAIAFTPVGSIVVQPGQFLMIKWTDTNRGDADGFQAIDDVSVEFTELTGTVTIATSARTRSDNGTPLDNTDDTFGFTATINGTGTVSANWITTDVNPPVSNFNIGPYGTPVVWTGFPIAPKTVTVTDSVNGLLSNGVTVEPLVAIGSNNLVTAGTLIIQEDVPLVGWTSADAARTLTQVGQTAQTDKIVNSQLIDLSAAGNVQFVAQLDALAGTSSGFEAADAFGLELIIDAAPPVSVFGISDIDGNGRLNGAANDTVVNSWVELPDAGEMSKTGSFSFSYIIPAAANNVLIRIIGNSNSGSETFLVKNIALNPAPPTVAATIAGPSVRDNKGTVDPADDTFSGFATIFPVDLGASPGWHSDEVPAHTGLYSDANPVTFGPYLISGGARLVTLTDDLALPTVSTAVRFPLPPAATLTASAPTNIRLVENLPGTDDDVVTFDATITSTNGGPSWTATGALPASGAYGVVSFTIPAPLPAVSPVAVTIADASFPTLTAVITVPLPTRYIIGQKDFGAGLSDVKSDLAINPDVEWRNDATLRTLTMTAGVVDDSLVASEIINLSATGIVYFSANLRASETSTGSNFEVNDRFKAELIIDGGTAAEQVINLVSSYDTGDGAPAVGAAGGVNGPPNGYINGYQGIAVAPASAADDYNANRERDEFNLAAPTREPVATQIANNFPMTYTIPASASSVQLMIYGAGVATSETFLVSGVIFSTTALSDDTDGDGVTNDDEDTMGTDPADPNDVLRLTQNSANPLQLDFTAEAGRFYRVYSSDDTDGQEATHLSIWKDAGPPIIVGNTGSITITVAPAEARRFYRLHVMKTDGPANDGVWPATAP